MATLNLIVHEDIIQRRSSEHDGILWRISEVKKKSSPHVKSISTIDGEMFLYSLASYPVYLAKNYDTVILLGGSIKNCLDIVAEALMDAGKAVAHDIEGTSD